MLVCRSNLEECLAEISAAKDMGLDTETTGLAPYQGDRLFSIAVAIDQKEFYFNFQSYPGLSPDQLLNEADLKKVTECLSRFAGTIFIQNAKFDMAILAAEDCFLGNVHCTKAQGRVEYNEHLSYSLEAIGERIGFPKDKAVEEYITAHGLTEEVWLADKGVFIKKKRFDKVPLEVIAPYAERDAKIARLEGLRQVSSIEAQGEVQAVMQNERKLTHTVFRMERTGLMVDLPYVARALAYEWGRAEGAQREFVALTGRKFMASPKLFAEVFSDQKSQWEYTEKGNPSFETAVLKKFNSPVAKAVLEYRDAKSKTDFYLGFQLHCDKDGFIHPNLNPDGAAHGRFSSSNPNFQNLTAEHPWYCPACPRTFEQAPTGPCECGNSDLREHEFLVRKAIIPPPGYLFIMPDYNQMEYLMMLDYAAQQVGYETPLVAKVKTGYDVHRATAESASTTGIKVSRTEAKTSNFLTIYGGGEAKLAKGLGCSRAQAAQIRGAIQAAAPEISILIHAIVKTAETRGYIRNWLGRRCYFPDKNFTYRAPNYLIAGGCADVNKVALNRIDEALRGMKSKLVLTVHDENPCIVHESERATVPRLVKEIMESVYPAKYLPLTCGMEYSYRSLAHKVAGFPG